MKSVKKTFREILIGKKELKTKVADKTYVFNLSTKKNY